MLILLPPSETKWQPEAGPRLDLSGLVAPELTKVRRTVLDHLVRMCAGNPRVAMRALGISVRQVDELHRNSALKRAACAPATDVYTGVLYDALQLPSLPAAARRRAGDRILIASALFGVARPGDLIPAYRLSGGSTVTGLDSLTRTWKEPLGSALLGLCANGLVFDLRSSDYASLGPVPSGMVQRTVVGKVVDSSTGRKLAVSHFNKATKGLLTRELLRSAKDPRTPTALARMCEAAGFEVALVEPVRDRSPWLLEIEQHHG